MSNIRDKGIDRIEEKIKQAEDELRKSKEYFSKAEKIAHLGYWEWDMVTNKLTWSDEVFRIYGLDPEKVVPTYETVVSTLGQDTREWFTKAIDDAINRNKPFEGEYSLTRPDGSVRYTHTIGEVIRDKDGKPLSMFGVVQDITERKQADERLKMFRNLIDRSNDAIFVNYPETGRIIDVNERACISLGYTREELLKMQVYDFEVSVPERFSWKDHVNEIKNKGHLILEGRHRRKDGTTFPVEANVSYIDLGDANYMIAVLRDITERKQAEEKLQKNEASLASAQRLAHIGSWEWDVASNTALWSDETYRIFGLGRPDKLEQHRHNFLQMIHTDDRAIVDQALSDALNGTKEYDVEYRIILEDKIEKMIHARAEVVRNNEGKPLMMRGTVHDITERKKAEKLLLENLRLEATDKAKSDFLATMSHELRTPLNAIIGFSELLRMNKCGELTEKQSNYVDNIRYGGKHLLDIITDILDLSKVEAGKMDLLIEKISLPETINETIDLINENALKNKVRIKKEFDFQAEFIQADKQRIKQILFNLLSNAIKFSKNEEGTVTIYLKKEGDMARISISDTGIGIRKEDLERLFKEFQQLDSGVTRKYGGTGLGLAICKKLVELHKGKITVESKYGEGTTFHILLPV